MVHALLKDKLLKRLTGGASITVAISAGSALLTFLMQIFLARWLGTADFGYFMLVSAWMHILTILGTLGLNNVVMRFLSAYHGNKEWRLFKGMLTLGHKYAFWGGIVVTGITSLILFCLFNDLTEVLLWSFAIMLLIVPLRCVTAVQIGSVRALHHMFAANFPESILRSFLFILAAYGLQKHMGEEFDAVWAISISLAAHLITYLIYVFILKHTVPQQAKNAEAYYDVTAWRGVIGALFISTIMNVIMHKSDIVLVGAFMSPEETGIYAAFVNIASILWMGYAALTMMFSPFVSELYHTGKLAEVKRVANFARWLQIAGFGTGTAIILLFHKTILSWFGPAFLSDPTPVLILAIGFFIASFAGQSQTINNMTGKHRITAIMFSICVVIKILLSIILIPLYGLNAAALITSGCWILFHGSMAIIARKNLVQNS